jgi:hypothetical protein
VANTVVISSGVMVMQPQKEVVTGVWLEGELPTMVSEEG